MKKLTLLTASIFVLSLSSSLMATDNKNESMNTSIDWITIEEAQKKMENDPKKIFMDIYTDWCGWCKRMDANTFSHPQIAEYINENYYAVKLNAEQADPINFRGVEYVNENPNQRRSSHNFAIAVLQGKMSYPSVAFFDEEMNLITALPGYREPQQFEPILVFFSEDVYLKNPDLGAFIEKFEGNIK